MTFSYHIACSNEKHASKNLKKTDMCIANLMKQDESEYRTPNYFGVNDNKKEGY